jgi:hypothetical protein
MATLVCLAGIRMHRASLRFAMYLGNCSCIALGSGVLLRPTSCMAQASFSTGSPVSPSPWSRCNDELIRGSYNFHVIPFISVAI